MVFKTLELFVLLIDAARTVVGGKTQVTGDLKGENLSLWL